MSESEQDRTPDLVERLRDEPVGNHAKLCQGREYACSCGGDDEASALVLEAASEIQALRQRVEGAEGRVAAYLIELTGIGAGDDPIGFLMASHAAVREQRDEAQCAVTAWQQAVEALEAHIMDRAAMKDPASPETYLRILKSEVANITRTSEQIVNARWADARRARAQIDRSEFVCALMAAAAEGNAKSAALWWQVYQDRCEGALIEQTVVNAERRALTLEREGLREGLKPFAQFAEDNTEADAGAPGYGVWAGNRCEGDRIRDWFGPTDFYRARQALLSPIQEGGGEGNQGVMESRTNPVGHGALPMPPEGPLLQWTNERDGPAGAFGSATSETPFGTYAVYDQRGIWHHDDPLTADAYKPAWRPAWWRNEPAHLPRDQAMKACEDHYRDRLRSALPHSNDEGEA